MLSSIEKRPLFLTILISLFILLSTITIIFPDFSHMTQPSIGTKPHSVLELAGRQIYIKEGCIACHSQLVRPLKNETDRYGKYSISGEYAFERPSLFGSSRLGPDLLRVGNYRTTQWHEKHMYNPQSVAKNSIMPSYKHMFSKRADIETAWAVAYTNRKIFNVPYNRAIIQDDGSKRTVKLASSVLEAKKEALIEAKKIVYEMENADVKKALHANEIPEIVAIIAYLNSLR